MAEASIEPPRKSPPGVAFAPLTWHVPPVPAAQLVWKIGRTFLLKETGAERSALDVYAWQPPPPPPPPPPLGVADEHDTRANSDAAKPAITVWCMVLFLLVIALS
jgi:hypothetical protein